MRYRALQRCDLPRLRSFSASHARADLHAVDGPYRLAAALAGDPGYAQLCETEGGDLLGWALLLLPWQTIDLVAAPAAGEVEAGLLGWAVDCWAEGLGRRGQHLWVEAAEDDTGRRDMLAGSGFELDSWWLHDLTLDLAGTPAGAPPARAAPALPPGFLIRPLVGEAEAPAAAALHREAFSSDFMTDSWRAEILRIPGYHPELDLVAVAPDGRIAGYCLSWLAGAEARIEPLAVHPSYRGLGLSRALMTAGFERLMRLGARTARVECLDSNQAGLAAYTSVGFRPARRILEYVLRFPRQA